MVARFAISVSCEIAVILRDSVILFVCWYNRWVCWIVRLIRVIVELLVDVGICVLGFVQGTASTCGFVVGSFVEEMHGYSNGFVLMLL